LVLDGVAQLLQPLCNSLRSRRSDSRRRGRKRRKLGGGSSSEGGDYSSTADQWPDESQERSFVVCEEVTTNQVELASNSAQLIDAIPTGKGGDAGKGPEIKAFVNQARWSCGQFLELA
jgi:hypothetical protein